MLSSMSTDTFKSFSSGLSPFSAQPVFVLEIALMHVQDLELGDF